jgi:LysR family transcriptional regulator, low CO2-responsive transcriptional regulator
MDRRISLHKLEVFCLVVELGGVGRAAERLFVSQPVVTAHIRSLEQRLGAQLFFREGRHLHLTEAGRSAHAWACDVLVRTRELDRQLDGLSDGRRGSVVVGAGMSVGSYVLPAVLTRFRRDRPDVDVSLFVSEADEVLQATGAGRCDFAVCILERRPESADLHTEHLRDEELVVVGGPDADLPDGPISVAELAKLPMLDPQNGQARRSVIHNQIEKVTARRNVVLELGHPEAMKRVAAQGLGVAMLFRMSVRDEIRLGLLREIPLRGVTLAVPVYLTHRHGKHFSASQRELMEIVREELAAEA